MCQFLAIIICYSMLMSPFFGGVWANDPQAVTGAVQGGAVAPKVLVKPEEISKVQNSAKTQPKKGAWSPLGKVVTVTAVTVVCAVALWVFAVYSKRGSGQALSAQDANNLSDFRFLVWLRQDRKFRQNIAELECQSRIDTIDLNSLNTILSLQLEFLTKLEAISLGPDSFETLAALSRSPNYKTNSSFGGREITLETGLVNYLTTVINSLSYIPTLRSQLGELANTEPAQNLLGWDYILPAVRDRRNSASFQWLSDNSNDIKTMLQLITNKTFDQHVDENFSVFRDVPPGILQAIDGLSHSFTTVELVNPPPALQSFTTEEIQFWMGQLNTFRSLKNDIVHKIDPTNVKISEMANWGTMLPALTNP
jgi:hypothetical protein